MKGSSLHRSGLTREKIGLLASFLQTDKKQTSRSQLNNNNSNNYKAPKNHELDILWGGVQKSIQKVHNATKSPHQKSPAVYLLIGFIAGVLFTSLITFIVSISSMAPVAVSDIENKEKTGINVPAADENLSGGVDETDVEVESGSTNHEKYIVKSGDTLNGIAYRFYGKYDEAKLKEIQRINNLVNPEALKIDQELLIPVSQDR